MTTLVPVFIDVADVPGKTELVRGAGDHEAVHGVVVDQDEGGLAPVRVTALLDAAHASLHLLHLGV